MSDGYYKSTTGLILADCFDNLHEHLNETTQSIVDSLNKCKIKLQPSKPPQFYTPHTYIMDNVKSYYYYF